MKIANKMEKWIERKKYQYQFFSSLSKFSIPEKLYELKTVDLQSNNICQKNI